MTIGSREMKTEEKEERLIAEENKISRRGSQRVYTFLCYFDSLSHGELKGEATTEVHLIREVTTQEKEEESKR